MEHLATTLSTILALGVAAGGVTTAIDQYKYDNALESPDFLYLVDEFGNPVSQELE